MKTATHSILAGLMLAIALPAAAGWEKVWSSDEAEMYIDPDTFQKTGALRKVWALQNLKRQGNGGVLSRRYFAEYHCKEKRYTILSASTHSMPMATGKTLELDPSPSESFYIAPGTYDAFILDVLCSD